MTNQDTEDKGEITSSELKNGPKDSRGCTDIFCCLIFVAFFVATIGVSIWSFKHGHPKSLATPYDPDKRGCGVDKGVEDYPLIYFTQPTTSTLWRTVCVKECPKYNTTVLECAPNKIVTDCGGMNANTSTSTSNDTASTTVIYNTFKLSKICIPHEKATYEKIAASMKIGNMDKTITDVKNTWTITLATAGIALVLGLVFMILVRYCAGVVIWIFLFASIVSLLLLAGLLLSKYAGYSVSYKNGKVSTASHATSEMSDKQKYGILSAGIMSALGALLLMIGTCCFCKKIKLAIAILKTSALFVSDNLSVLFLPISLMISILLYFIYWILIALCLYTAGEMNMGEHNLPFATYKMNQNAKYGLWFHIFALFWMLSFLIACSDFILSSAVSIWYFRAGQDGPSPTRTSIYRLIRFHMGSVAFGSLILAIVWFLQVLLEYITQKTKDSGADENKVLKAVLCCCKCCLACFEKCIRFLTEAAYTIIAMTGKSFCSAAKDAFFLALRNPVRFSIVGGIGAIFTALGRMFISLSSAIIGYMIITKSSSFHLNSPVVPTILFAIVGFCIGSVFMSVYGTASDAILIVFTMDEEIEKEHFNKSSAANCPEPLRDFINECDKN